MNLNSQCFDVVGSICSSSQISKIQLDLIPSLIQFQGHGADKRFDSCDSLQQNSENSSWHVARTRETTVKHIEPIQSVTKIDISHLILNAA